jgi:hypothetical protein
MSNHGKDCVIFTAMVPNSRSIVNFSLFYMDWYHEVVLVKLIK